LVLNIKIYYKYMALFEKNSSVVSLQH
jgi:hypothetical protein